MSSFAQKMKIQNQTGSTARRSIFLSVSRNEQRDQLELIFADGMSLQIPTERFTEIGHDVRISEDGMVLVSAETGKTFTAVELFNALSYQPMIPAQAA